MNACANPQPAIFSITIEGEPIAQGRPRGVRVANRIIFYDPAPAKRWKNKVAAVIRVALREQWGTWRPPADFIWSLEADFYLQRPQSHFRSNGQLKPWAPKYCANRPDLDNLAKTLLDALTKAGVFEEDARVVELIVRKFWADSRLNAQGPRVELTLAAVPPPPGDHRES